MQALLRSIPKPGYKSRVRGANVPEMSTFKGMSVGPGGLLQGLKAIPMIVEIAQEMESLCPNAKLINYTNPMSSIVLGLQRYSRIPSVGVCPGLEHEISHYAHMLGVPEDELEVRAAGVNHCDFILELRPTKS